MFKKLAWALIRPVLLPYLAARGLVLPQAKRIEFAHRFNVPVEKLQAIEEGFRGYVLSTLENYRP